MVSETDPLIYSVKYSSKIARFNDIINHYISRMIFIVPNTKNQFSFNVVSNNIHHSRIDKKCDNKCDSSRDVKHKYDYKYDYNYFLIGSATTTGSVDVDAELESYASITLGDSFTVNAHNLPKLHFNNNIVLNLISKMQILKHLFGEHHKLLNSNEKFKLIDLSVKIMIEADTYLSLEKYVIANECIYTYLLSVFTKLAGQKNLRIELQQHTFMSQLSDKMLEIKNSIYQFCSNGSNSSNSSKN